MNQPTGYAGPPITTHPWLQPLYSWLKGFSAFSATAFGAIGDGVTDDSAAIQSAINAAEVAGGDVLLPPGILVLGSPLSITSSNVRIRGAGRGVTTLAISASQNGSSAAAINAYNSTFGTSQALAADATSGDFYVTLSTPSAAGSLSSGNWVLIRSLRSVDSESPTNKFAGELQRVASADATTGVVTFYGSLADSYTVSQSASIIQVSMLDGIGLSGFSVTHQLTTAPAVNSAAILLRNCHAAQVEDIEIHDVFNTGLDVWSNVDTTIRGCVIDNVQAGSSNTVYYGIWISGASRGVNIDNCTFSRCRHSVTHGTHTNSGSNTLSTDAREGIQRNSTISRCRSSASTTAHFDVHQPAEGVLFDGCTVQGAWPQGSPDPTTWSGSVYGGQSRGKRVTYRGCLIEQTSGGILLFGPNTQDNLIIGCIIRDIKQSGVQQQLASGITSGATSVPLLSTLGLSASGSVTISGSTVTYTSISGGALQGCSGAPTAAAGTGVYQLVSGTGNGIELDSTCTGTGIVIADCEILDTTASGVRGQGNQSRVTVRGCLLGRNSIIGNFGSIQFSSATDRIVIESNRVFDNPNSRSVSITGSGDWHVIANNVFEFCINVTPGWVGPNSRTYNNRFFVPGAPSNPFPQQVLGTAWVASGVYSAGNVASNNNNNYVCQIGGIAAGSGGPSGTGNGNITDGTVIWKWLYSGMVSAWLPNTLYPKGTMRSNAGRIFECYSTGTSATGASGPISNSTTSITTEPGPSGVAPTWRFIYEGAELISNIVAASGTATPISGYSYAVRSAPATLILSGGAVTNITVNGTTVATGSTGMMGPIKLGIGDSFSLSYPSGSAPTAKLTFEG